MRFVPGCRYAALIGTLTTFLFSASAGNSVASADDLKVWAGGVVQVIANDIGLQFERATTYKVAFEFGTSPAFGKKIEDGQSFDVVILVPQTIDDWIKKGLILEGSRTDIARAGLGVAIRAGAPKPDITSLEGLKQTLLNANSVAHATEGATTAQFMRLLERLEISEKMKDKLRPTAGNRVIQSVAQGDAEMVVLPIPEIVGAPGLESAGPLPPDLQTYVILTAGISTSAGEPKAAQAFIKFLTEPSVIAIIKAKGLELVIR